MGWYQRRVHGENHEIVKMKIFSLLGVALAKECYEDVFAAGRAAERGKLSALKINTAIEEFASCAERDPNLPEFPELPGLLPLPDYDQDILRSCLKYFLNAMYECTKVQENHPFCKEDHPNYNPFMCAIKLSFCIVEEIQGISSCIDIDK